MLLICAIIVTRPGKHRFGGIRARHTIPSFNENSRHTASAAGKIEDISPLGKRLEAFKNASFLATMASTIVVFGGICLRPRLRDRNVRGPVDARPYLTADALKVAMT